VNHLFIELYLDEDVSSLVADPISGRCFDVVTTRAAGNLGNSDAAQLEYAISQNRTLLTHNRADFEALAQAYFAAGKAHSGIIIAVRHPPHEIVRRLLLIMNHVTADEMKDQVRYI